MTKKRTTKPADPAKLAAAFVKDRLAFCDDYDQFVADDDNEAPERTTFYSVVRAARRQNWPDITEDMISALYDRADKEISENVVLATSQAHARAGFLVGLELGRRLAGAR